MIILFIKNNFWCIIFGRREGQGFFLDQLVGCWGEGEGEGWGWG